MAIVTQDPNPLSVWYMEAVLEERPTLSERLGPRIGDRFLPIREYNSYRIVWEKVREYSPIAGAYALEDLPDTMVELDFTTFQSDVLHWGARMTLDPKDVAFFRFAGQTNVANATTGYGVGPAADEYRAKDAALVAKKTRMMNSALENTREYLQMKSLLGYVIWPPRASDGTEIAAADLPLNYGRQKLVHEVPFLATAGGDGGFHQAATTLAGLSGGRAATGVAWNASTANVIQDMAVIADLLDERMYLDSGNLLVLMAKRVLGHAAVNSNVLDWILGENRDRTFMTDTDIRQFIQTQFEWEIEFYNSRFEWVSEADMDSVNPTIHSIPFMDAGTVLIIPKSDIVDMGVVATAPAPGPAHNWQSGKYMWMTMDERPPFKKEMGMGMFMWPLVFDTDLRFRLDAWS